MRILLSAVLLFLTGCASIVNGQNQSLSVEARSDSGRPVSGATCRLTNNKGEWFITTPGSTTVNRSYENLSVRCEKDAEEPGLASVKSSTKGMAYGNILFGGIIGAGVDMSTGAAYDYPPLVTVVMGKSSLIGEPPPATATKTPADIAQDRINAAAASPAPAAASAPAAATQTPPPTPAPSIVAAPVAAPTPPVPAPAAALPPAPAAAPPQAARTLAIIPAGYVPRHLYQAEHLPEVRACPYGPDVSLVATSPGVEIYSAPCGRAEALMLRCEWGTCRVLK